MATTPTLRVTELQRKVLGLLDEREQRELSRVDFQNMIDPAPTPVAVANCLRSLEGRGFVEYMGPYYNPHYRISPTGREAINGVAPQR